MSTDAQAHAPTREGDAEEVVAALLRQPFDHFCTRTLNNHVRRFGGAKTESRVADVRGSVVDSGAFERVGGDLWRVVGWDK